MKSKLICVLAFTLGAAVGSVATWQVLEKKIEAKYEALVQEEIESIKEVSARKNNTEPVEEDTDQNENKESEGYDVNEYSSLLKNEGYTEEYEEVKKVDEPYVIPPDEFGELDEYETISLTYYSDGYLVDDMGELVEDVEDVVGLDFKERFGEYEDDCVYVRNDSRKADYEILYDIDRFDG